MIIITLLMKHLLIIIILILIILLLSFKQKAHCILDNSIFNLYNKFAKHSNKKIFDLIYQMNYENIDINNIPKILEDKINILQIDNFNHRDVDNKKILIKKIIDKIKSNKNNIFPTEQLRVLDFLNFKTPYHWGPHNDIEWNLVENDGYQVWFLLKNDCPSNFGNMFLMYNHYIFNKYKDIIFYQITVRNNMVVLYKNCKNNSFFLRDGDILEIFSIDWFLKNSYLYYLNIQPNQFLVFNRNICHMTDIRNTKKRHAINFRLMQNDVLYKNNNCGFVKKKVIEFSN